MSMSDCRSSVTDASALLYNNFIRMALFPHLVATVNAPLGGQAQIDRIPTALVNPSLTLMLVKRDLSKRLAVDLNFMVSVSAHAAEAG
jgi:hypothetical protein